LGVTLNGRWSIRRKLLLEGICTQNPNRPLLKGVFAVLVISRLIGPLMKSFIRCKVTIADMGYSGTTDEKGIGVLKATTKLI
jgi:hypothetical protein